MHTSFLDLLTEYRIQDAIMFMPVFCVGKQCNIKIHPCGDFFVRTYTHKMTLIFNVVLSVDKKKTHPGLSGNNEQLNVSLSCFTTVDLESWDFKL